MKTFLLSSLLLAFLAANSAAQEPRSLYGAAAPPAPKAGNPLLLLLRLCEGDPSGSREKGTLRVLAEPMLAVTENVPFAFSPGNPVPVQRGIPTRSIRLGYEIRGEAAPVEAGRVPLSITLSHRKLVERTDAVVRLHNDSTDLFASARVGETLKIDLPPSKRLEPVWLEVLVEEVQPQARNKQ